MKTAAIIRHLHFEDLGILQTVLHEHAYHIRYYDAGLDDFSTLNDANTDLLVVLGGPIGVYEAETYPFVSQELALIRQRLQAQRPTLGICLGAQLMAASLDAEVKSMGVQEIGFFPLQLTPAGEQSVLAGLAADLPVLHWHGDQFELPLNSSSLATTAICPHQAFALGNYALGLQFHLEVDMARFEPWLIASTGQLAKLGIDPRTLRQQAKDYAAGIHNAGRAVFSRWLDGLA